MSIQCLTIDHSIALINSEYDALHHPLLFSFHFTSFFLYFSWFRQQPFFSAVKMCDLFVTVELNAYCAVFHTVTYRSEWPDKHKFRSLIFVTTDDGFLIASDWFVFCIYILQCWNRLPFVMMTTVFFAIYLIRFDVGAFVLPQFMPNSPIQLPMCCFVSHKN